MGNCAILLAGVCIIEVLLLVFQRDYVIVSFYYHSFSFITGDPTWQKPVTKKRYAYFMNLKLKYLGVAYYLNKNDSNRLKR